MGRWDWKNVCVMAALVALSVGAVGCSGDSARSCEEDGDCFSGESCIDEICVNSSGTSGSSGGGGTTGGSGSGSTGGGPSGGEGTSGAETTGGTTGSSGGSAGGSTGESASGSTGGSTSGGGTTTGSGGTTGGLVCGVDSFSCEDDAYEQEHHRWRNVVNSLASLDEDTRVCEDGVLAYTEKTWEMQYCPGNPFDAYRWYVSDPHTKPCFPGAARFTVTVEVPPECTPEQVDVFPFFSDRSLCGADKEWVECKGWEGNTFTMVWEYSSQELQDYRLQFLVRDASGENLNFPYKVHLKIEGGITKGGGTGG